MKIKNRYLANKILDFLNKKIDVDELVNWAENAMIEGDYQDKYFEEISNGLAKIGVINVKGFELSIADYLNILVKLDYIPKFYIENRNENDEKINYY